MQKKKALIAGASGLVGGHCLRYLLQDDEYDAVVSIGRSLLPVSHSKLTQLVVDFDHLGEHGEALAADVVFCCLGTTLRQAGSREQFRKVDFEYVVRLAQLAKQQQARQFVVLSSMGADADAVFFYARVKGDTEKALTGLNYRSLHILRPASLAGDRREFRLGERISLLLLKAVQPLLPRKYRPIEAQTVAKAMLVAASRPQEGTFTYNSDELAQMAIG